MIRRIPLSAPITPALIARCHRLRKQIEAEYKPLLDAAPNQRAKLLLAAQASSLLVARMRAILPARAVN